MVTFALNIETGFTHFMSYFMGESGKYSLAGFFLTITVIIMVISFVAIPSLSNFMSVVFFQSPAYTDVLILMGGVCF